MLPEKPSQASAPRHLILELRKNGNVYSFAQCLPATDPAAVGIRIPHGFYSFVILSDAPGIIYCGIPLFVQEALKAECLSAYAGRNVTGMTIEGHASISNGADVLYAGELVLQNGQLMRWGNASGHYHPPASLRTTNMLPMVKLLLPDHLFVSHLEEMSLLRRRVESPSATPLNNGYV